MSIYLDNAATKPLSEETKRYLMDILNNYGNPSSTHSIGDNAKQVINKARQTVSVFINANEKEIIFTSGGSASNTLAITGFKKANPKYKIIYSPIAHKSIVKQMGQNDIPLKVGNDGVLCMEYLQSITNDNPNSLVVVDYANSEIGTIQNVNYISKIVHSNNCKLYLDCTGSIPTIPLDVKEINVDMAGFSAHKLGGLKGCGVLYKKDNIKLSPIIFGSQEQGLFGGTENVIGIASLYKAIELYRYNDLSYLAKKYVWENVKNMVSDCYVVGGFNNKLINNLCICIKGVLGQHLIVLLDQMGIQVSTGSACNSGNLEPSYVLKEIGINECDYNSCIRITFSGNETQSELDYVCQSLKDCVELLRRKDF